MSYATHFANLEESTSRNASRLKDYFSAEQRRVLSVPYSEDALLIAGAGAGKTGVLVERACNLLKAGANPERLGIFAFTKKSAGEILERIQLKLGKHSQLPKCSTLHALAYSLVAKDDTIRLAEVEHEEYALEKISEFLSDKLAELTRSELTTALNRAREEYDQSTELGMLGLAYEEYLKEQGVWDFTMLLSVATKKKRKLFDYIIVDEVQDLSQLQLSFLLAVAPDARKWFIGDPDQAIYVFRGAQPGMMAKLNELVPNVYFLNTNYRCDRDILGAANNVITHNVRPFQNEWVAASPNAGSVTVKGFPTSALELEFAREWLQNGNGRKDRAVLARTQAQVAALKAEGLEALTVHESKGLEWNQVLVIGCEEGTFPHPMSAP